jgi:hypothetical protein
MKYASPYTSTAWSYLKESGQSSRCSGYAVGWTTEKSCFDFTQGQEILLISNNVQTSSRTHPASFSVGKGEKLAIHLCLEPTLRMTEAIHMFPTHTFMASTGTTLATRYGLDGPRIESADPDGPVV